jgi:hypothetical protein
MEEKMAKPKNNDEITLDDLKKSIDRLAIIELVKAGATRSQVRDIMGSINNQAFGRIHHAMKKATADKEGEE